MPALASTYQCAPLHHHLHRRPGHSLCLRPQRLLFSRHFALHRQQDKRKQSCKAWCVSPARGSDPGISTNQTDAALAMLQEEGFSQADAKLLLQKYPAYKTWDAGSQLKAATLQWRQELGLKQLIKTLRSCPSLLIYRTSKLHDYSSYISSLVFSTPGSLS